MNATNFAWTIAGTDPTGAAGMQADLKTFAAFGVSAGSVITNVTAQNSDGVFATAPVTCDLLSAQMRHLAAELPPFVIKIGLLGAADSISTLVDNLPASAYVIYDPVFCATSGGNLLAAETITAAREFLFPRVDLLTPNRLEAETLVGYPITESRIEKAARTILDWGVKSVLIKGGHFSGKFCADFWTDGNDAAWFGHPRLDVKARGTGCTLASAIAAAKARGETPRNAIAMAKIYLHRELRVSRAKRLPHLPWGDPFAPSDLVTLGLPESESFSPAQNMGLYAIVDRAANVKFLGELGVKTMQLRIKDLSGAALEREISTAIEFARNRNVLLFINDFWELGLKLGAAGVHLGQEDLDTTHIAAIRKAKLKLGVSTHDFAELARAHAVRPSYIALGPIFPTTTKVMRFGPQGIAKVKLWRSLLDCPLVAIGGVNAERASQVLAAGADSLAVLSDLSDPLTAAEKVRGWNQILKPSKG